MRRSWPPRSPKLHQSERFSVLDRSEHKARLDDVMTSPLLKTDEQTTTPEDRIEGFRQIFSELAKGAGERDAQRIAPHDQVNELKRAGFGTLRIPKADGGLGLTFVELIDLVVELAKA